MFVDLALVSIGTHISKPGFCRRHQTRTSSRDIVRAVLDGSLHRWVTPQFLRDFEAYPMSESLNGTPMCGRSPGAVAPRQAA